MYGFLSFILLVHTRYKSYPTPVFSLLCVLLWGVTWLSGTSTCWVLTYGYLKEVEEPPSFSRDVAIEWKDSMRFMERGDYVLLDNANKTIMYTIPNFSICFMGGVWSIKTWLVYDIALLIGLLIDVFYWIRINYPWQHWLWKLLLSISSSKIEEANVGFTQCHKPSPSHHHFYG